MRVTVIYLTKDKIAVGLHMFNTSLKQLEYSGNAKSEQLVIYKK